MEAEVLEQLCSALSDACLAMENDDSIRHEANGRVERKVRHQSALAMVDILACPVNLSTDRRPT